MSLIDLDCPKCGAGLQLDSTLKQGFCQYCGHKILIQDEVQKVEITNLPKIQNYISLATSSLEDFHFDKALEYFYKVLEIDSENQLAGALKTIAETLNRVSFLDYKDEAAFSGKNHFINIQSEVIYKKFELSEDEKTYIRSFLTKLSHHIYESNVDKFLTYLKPALGHSVLLLKSKKFLLEYQIFFTNLTYLLDSCLSYYSESNDSDGERIYLYGTYLESISQMSKQKSFGGLVLKYDGNPDNEKPITFIRNISPELSDKYKKYSKDLLNIEPNAKLPLYNPTEGGCYIATAVYGSYDAPEVLVLRRFRDTKLNKSVAGREFIRIYYKYSPSLAIKLKGFGIINLSIRKILDSIIYYLD